MAVDGPDLQRYMLVVLYYLTYTNMTDIWLYLDQKNVQNISNINKKHAKIK